VTFTQLRCFSTVARLGSVKRAASELGVSEPAVSEAVSALRKALDDPLLVRSGGGLELTAGGRRLAAIAAEILALSDRARTEVQTARGERTLLRVAATSDVAEHASDRLLDAFTRKMPGLDVAESVEPASELARLLAHRLADVTLGPRAPGEAELGIESVPFLRYRLLVVGGSEHPLARGSDLAPPLLAGERWLSGPSGAAAAFLARHGLDAGVVRTFPSDAAALAEVAAGRGIALAIAHTVLDELRRGSLVRLPVRGTPVDGLWYASALRAERRTPAAWALRRFVTSPEATHALLARPGGVPAGRYRPAVHVTLWNPVEVGGVDHA
jgi:LysR family transcriptional regulator, low CO2-responsive transcriptional regulator